MNNLHFSILGKRILVRCGNSLLQSHILESARQLLVPAFSETPDVTFMYDVLSKGTTLPDFDSLPQMGISPQEDFVIRGGVEERWIIVEGKSATRYDSGEKVVRGLVHPDHMLDGWVIGHRLFFIPLLERMRCSGHYPLHGSCFQAGGKWVIVSGPSGAGKSTAVLSAIAAGCPYVADDTLFMTENKGSIIIDPFPEPVKVGKGTARFFPEWKDILIPAGPKYILDEDRLHGPGRVSGISPKIILFPEITDRDESAFRFLPKHEAMIRLMPQSVLPTDAAGIQNHIGILSRLVESVRSYVLLFGRDLRDLPERIHEL